MKDVRSMKSVMRYEHPSDKKQSKTIRIPYYCTPDKYDDLQSVKSEFDIPTNSELVDAIINAFLARREELNQARGKPETSPCNGFEEAMMSSEIELFQWCLNMAKAMNDTAKISQLEGVIKSVEFYQKLPDMIGKFTPEQQNLLQSAALLMNSLYEPQQQNSSKVVGRITPTKQSMPQSIIPMPYMPMSMYGK